MEDIVCALGSGLAPFQWKLLSLDLEEAYPLKHGERFVNFSYVDM